MSRRELHPLLCCLAVRRINPPSGRSLRDRPPSPASGEGKPPPQQVEMGCLVAGGVRPATRTLWFQSQCLQILSAALRRADRARGLAATSSSEGRTGCRGVTRRGGRGPQGQNGCWGGGVEALGSTFEKDVSKRAFREWELVVAL